MKRLLLFHGVIRWNILLVIQKRFARYKPANNLTALPPEVRRMSNYYKAMCACIVCVQMKLHQSTYNRFKGKLLKQLKEEVDSLRLGSRSRRISLDKYHKYKEESNTTNTVNDALKEVHCKAVSVGSEQLYHINCAFNR